jgi:hypothetical protein
MAFGPGKVAGLCALALFASPEDDGGPGVLLLLAAGLALVSAVIAALAYIGWQASRTGSLPPAATRRRAARTTPAAAPPDAELEWEAEIEWHHEPRGGARFSIVAGRGGGSERTPVTASEPLGWPPTGPESVDALKRAVEQLEAAALAAGWRPAPPGDTWYAKRFVWQPARARAAVASERARLDSNERPAN